ncbi:hypothetical protein ACFYO1_32460 [Nocardia sp. NPDC006044]|uniref:hypothetical protein n=1 Tax=Nocardia sp. NPDC006044 TaxID=3364306 RepID=UPI0036BC0686
MPRQVVTITLGELKWTNLLYAIGARPDRPGAPRPYLWTSFFKVDGDGVQGDGRGGLAGTPQIYVTDRNGDDPIFPAAPAECCAAIPRTVGQWSGTLSPIPAVAGPRNDHEGPGLVGVAVAVLQSQGFSTAAAGATRAALDDAIRAAISRTVARESLPDIYVRLPDQVSAALCETDHRGRSRPSDQLLGHLVLTWCQPWSTGKYANQLLCASGDQLFSGKLRAGWWEEWELNGLVATRDIVDSPTA